MSGTVLHPRHHARAFPDKPAIVMGGSGEVVTYAELDARADQGAQLFRHWGLNNGDVVALMLRNGPTILEIAWAAQRSGLFYACASITLKATELEHIVRDSGARVLIVSPDFADAARAVAAAMPGLRLAMTPGSADGFEDFLAARAAMPASPITDEAPGADMLYSSGTTGAPKGLKGRVLDTLEAPTRTALLATSEFGVDGDVVYLCPAPLYHAGPLRWTMAMLQHGGTVVVMERFDAEQALALIQRYGVTHAQWVPTHFTRLLQLPLEVRDGYDLSSLRCMIHAAAPCPVPLKEAMFDWLGPIIFEYYSGTEGAGFCSIAPEEWLTHRGSVGRAKLGVVHICDDKGEEVPQGQEGMVYFSGLPRFVFHNDPAKTAEGHNAQGWGTMGDIGWVDPEGYLYLTDRKSFTVISGGVNVYPQEIENLLATHPAVADSAVYGLPCPDLGERVVATLQLREGYAPDEALAAEITHWVKERLSAIKTPRKIFFADALPRSETGKLMKRLLRDAHLQKKGE